MKILISVLIFIGLIIVYPFFISWVKLKYVAFTVWRISLKHRNTKLGSHLKDIAKGINNLNTDKQ